ncbi:hypothetical protein D5086_028666 [Populus alba]|uniref:Uncharacterized protein n=1 Tax=Populus alba TaxID=43335 RepID=A0ACC4AS50_POPAL
MIPVIAITIYVNNMGPRNLSRLSSEDSAIRLGVLIPLLKASLTSMGISFSCSFQGAFCCVLLQLWSVDELNPKFVAITQAVEARLKSTNDTMDAIEISINDRFDRVQLALDRLRKVVLSKYPVDTETELSNELEKLRFATRVGNERSSNRFLLAYWNLRTRMARRNGTESTNGVHCSGFDGETDSKNLTLSLLSPLKKEFLVPISTM